MFTAEYAEDAEEGDGNCPQMNTNGHEWTFGSFTAAWFVGEHTAGGR